MSRSDAAPVPRGAPLAQGHAPSQRGAARARGRGGTHSRQRILDAALAEFADKGYAGARVRAIARRAGVNTQLISYYFGGKEGLYNELLAGWHQQEAYIEKENTSFADGVEAYLRAFAAQPELLRMFIWHGLTRRSPDRQETGAGPEEPPEIADLRRRQAAGEMADDIDPAYLLIAIMGAHTTIVTMPQMIERLCGLRADSEEFISAYASQLRLIIGHLAGSDSAGARASQGGGAPGHPPAIESNREHKA